MAAVEKVASLKSEIGITPGTPYVEETGATIPPGGLSQTIAPPSYHLLSLQWSLLTEGDPGGAGGKPSVCGAEVLGFDPRYLPSLWLSAPPASTKRELATA